MNYIIAALAGVYTVTGTILGDRVCIEIACALWLLWALYPFIRGLATGFRRGSRD